MAKLQISFPHPARPKIPGGVGRRHGPSRVFEVLGDNCAVKLLRGGRDARDAGHIHGPQDLRCRTETDAMSTNCSPRTPIRHTKQPVAGHSLSNGLTIGVPCIPHPQLFSAGLCKSQWPADGTDTSCKKPLWWLFFLLLESRAHQTHSHSRVWHVLKSKGAYGCTRILTGTNVRSAVLRTVIVGCAMQSSREQCFERSSWFS